MSPLKLPPEVATLFAMIAGLLGAVLTTAGFAPADANAAITALQYLLSAGVLIAGLVGHLHLHSQHVAAQLAIASAAVPEPPMTTAPAAPSYTPPALGTTNNTTWTPPTITSNASNATPVADTPVQTLPVVDSATASAT